MATRHARRAETRRCRAENAELRLARACSYFLDQAGLHGELGADVTTQLQLAVSDMYGEVEAPMQSAPSGA